MKRQHKADPSLKGTFVSVMILGALIILSWFGVFELFMNRN